MLPFHDPSRRRRLKKVGTWLLGTPWSSSSSTSLGVDVIGWLQDLWDEIKAVPAGYIVAALLFQTGHDDVLAARLVLRHPQRRLPGRGHVRRRS